VHRDIKPANILLENGVGVKIADFGLARLLGQSPTMPTLTGTHQLMGTPAYMAPEQIEGLPGIDHRADIYSMGVVFYELLTGELPLGRFSPPSERAKTDVRLDEVVFRTLAKDPSRRYQQASQLKTDVDTLRLPRTHAGATVAHPHRRRFRIAVAISTIGGLMVSVIVFTPIILLMRQEYLRGDAIKDDWIPLQAKHKARSEATLKSPFSRSEPLYGQPAIFIDESGPTLNAAEFSLSGEQLNAVNKILKTIREHYLQEEALHSAFSIDIAGVQTTELQPFPEQVRIIENDFWTQIAEVIPVEMQRQFRDRLELYSSSTRRQNGGMQRNEDDDPEPMSFYSDTPDESPGWKDSASRYHPGLLGWRQDLLPIQVRIAPQDGLFELSVAWKINPLNVRLKTSVLPASLQRFYRETGPWMAVEKAKAAYVTRNWMQVADAFSRTGRFRWYLSAEARSDGTANSLPVPEFGNEIARLNEFFERTRPPIEKNDEILRQLEEIKTLIRTNPAIAVEGLCSQGAQTFSDDVGKAWFLMSVIDAATRHTVDFEPATYKLEGVQINEHNAATGQLVSPDGKTSLPIKFSFLDDQWKIDSIGSDEEFQQQIRNSQHAEIEAVLENARMAYAAKEWQNLADCFTHTGRICWAQFGFDAPLAINSPAEPTSNGMTQELVNELITHNSDLAVLRSAAFERVITRACLAPPAAVRDTFAQAENLLSEEFSKILLGSKLLHRVETPISSLRLTDVHINGDIGSGNVVSE
ncbi:MAG: serine/threonine protein kinase, partial [Planctomycetaceae bacterium]|nr:serine/threonine protein kinase [Planctomycetaceae bacterium]